jgi:hypothetical protein
VWTIGSYDCTANCPHNENTRKEIEEQAFDLEFVRCYKISTQNQLQINYKQSNFNKMSTNTQVAKKTERPVDKLTKILSSESVTTQFKML